MKNFYEFDKNINLLMSVFHKKYNAHISIRQGFQLSEMFNYISA